MTKLPNQYIEIRQAILDDLAAIDALDVFAGDRKVEIEAGEIIVAVDSGVVAAYLMHNKKFFQRPFVWYVSVHPDHKRKGIAKMLFNHVEEIHRNNNHKLLFTSTEADNTEMLSFFNKYGYERSGSIENIQALAEVVFIKRL